MDEIIIRFVDHSSQKYETCGDYWTDENGNWQIRISRTGNISEKLVALHELAELIQVEHKGIPQQTITDFDIDFENKRKPGNLDEPGFENDAPYRDAHAAATAIELILCATLGVSWKEHEETINNLSYEPNANINIE